VILCLESSADPTVVGLVHDQALVTERVFSDRDQLVDEVERMLQEAGVASRALNQIAIGIGPGSFTGLRVSLAFAKGMARALEIPIWPVPSLKIIAANFNGRRVAVISPARRGHVHLAVFDSTRLEIVDGPAVLDHEALLSRVAADCLLAGPGIGKLSDSLREALGSRIEVNPDLHRPRAVQLARLSELEWSGRNVPDIRSLVPEYGLDFPA
jgi:tRNA threonylcarbamoyladenosine biosynthesis protein TsaB